MRQILVDGKPVWVDVPRDLPRFCSTCGGALGRLEFECPLCKDRAYERLALKDRLKVIE